MRQMNQMSMAAFFTKVKPELTKREEDVMDVVELKYPTTLEQVARVMRVPEHTISGRFTGLKKKDRIKAVGRTRNGRGSMVNLYAPIEMDMVYENE